MTEGTELIPARGWHKTTCFGHVCHAKRLGGHLFMAMRVGNIPVGIAFRSYPDEPRWGLVDVELEP